MRQADKENAKARLEALCTRWAALGPEDQGRKLDLENEIFMLVYDLFPGEENAEAVSEVFIQNWKHFDPAKGSAYGFFAGRIRWRKNDRYEARRKDEENTVPDTVPAGGGEDISRTANLPAGPGSDPEELVKLDGALCELLSLILDLRTRLQGRANNPARRNYFRMFFTDNVAAGLHDAPAPDIFARRERDLFAALKLEFLDFFMAESCRTVSELCASPLKPYGALVEGRDMVETKLPLPGDVYVSYLDRVEHTKAGLSAVSQQRTAYEAEVRKWLF